MRFLYCQLLVVTFATLLHVHTACPLTFGGEVKNKLAATPVAQWNFENELPGEVHGAAKLSPVGPTAPIYPGFSAKNSALSLVAPAWLKIKDDFADNRFDFTNGDEITLEAWVKATAGGDNMYIVGKGRTASGGAKGVNQNWAMRLRKVNGRPCLNFLFHSQGNETQKGDWHRWTSTSGFSLSNRWHHVAVRYKFGDPKSILGIIDGKEVKGKWDMGGETKLPPVVDNDDILIGSAMNGNHGNSFTGAIDNVAVHRRLVSAKELKDRFQWNPPKAKPPIIPKDKILVQLFGPLDNYKTFPLELEPPLFEWQQDQFGFVRIPRKYDSWGVRDDWGKTLLVRAWCKTELPPGEIKLLIRARGLARLKIDGKEILQTVAQVNRSGAHHVVDPLPKVPVTGMRPHWMNDREKIVTYQSDGREHLIQYDMIVGGPSYRVEFGEPCVAWSVDEKMFHLLSPRNATSTVTRSYPLTDQGWMDFVAEETKVLDRMDLERRQTANLIRSEYWANRHQYAKTKLLSSAVDSQTSSSIDQIIEARIDRVNAKTKASIQKLTASQLENADLYRDHVQPILNSHCFRCHGEKQKGEISIESRENLLKGGESGEASIVPGKPDESHLVALISAGADGDRMPPKGDGLTPGEIKTIRKWISVGAPMPASKQSAIVQTPVVDDFTFLRRVYIDTVGVPPTIEEANAFLNDSLPNRRERLVDRLLQDIRWADNWVGYWQDVLAENPNLLKPTLNNTGPFRWWIQEALIDNKPIDRFATELMLMLGSTWGGGSAGFSVASQNDVPMAAKAHVIGSAFLGVNMKCARCHDAPYHQWKQSDLFEMAAMLDRKTLKLPSSSTVPVAFFEKQSRKPLIDATLKPGTSLKPSWPFAGIATEVSDERVLDELMLDAKDTREKLALQVTTSRRFAEVIANRMWQRLMGAGLVEPVDDWEGNAPCDPDLLAKLTDHLIQQDYNIKELARIILTSKSYQRTATDIKGERHFEGPLRRRMSAEQIVDSALHVVGMKMETEPLTMDIEGTLPPHTFLHFGSPKRSWEFTTLANERDRPSLALPRVQAVADVLKAFGWRNSRPEPETTREETPNLIQPGVLANGTFGSWLTRLSDESNLTKMALRDQSVEPFVDNLFLKLLTRRPTEVERKLYVNMLSPGFDQRIVPESEIGPAIQPKRFRYVSWSNHLNTEANKIKVEQQAVARQGEPPTRYLRDAWRQRAEDAVWALLNSPEMVLVP